MLETGTVSPVGVVKLKSCARATATPEMIAIAAMNVLSLVKILFSFGPAKLS
jgi:hypothetical protein